MEYRNREEKEQWSGEHGVKCEEWRKHVQNYTGSREQQTAYGEWGEWRETAVMEQGACRKTGSVRMR